MKKTKLLFDDFEKIAQKVLDEENLKLIELDLSGSPSNCNKFPSLKETQHSLNRSTTNLSDWLKFEELHLSTKKNIEKVLNKPENLTRNLNLNNLDNKEIVNDKASNKKYTFEG